MQINSRAELDQRVEAEGPPWEKVMPISAGTRLSSSELLPQTGAGGMGEVYSAHDTKSQDVAQARVQRENATGCFSAGQISVMRARGGLD